MTARLSKQYCCPLTMPHVSNWSFSVKAEWQTGNFRKYIFNILLLLLLLIHWASPCIAQDTLSIRVGNFFPNYFQNEQGQWQGLDIELALALVERAGFKADVREIPWSRTLVMAQSGELDIIPNTNIKPDRSQYMYWIGPARYTKLQLTVR